MSVKAHPYLGWSLIIALLTAVMAFIIHRITATGSSWAYLVAINIVSLVLFWYDKQVSGRKKADRIPNLVLFGLALVGGSAGALVGIRWLHHKTSRRYAHWRVIVWLSLFAYAALVLSGFVGENECCRAFWR